MYRRTRLQSSIIMSLVCFGITIFGKSTTMAFQQPGALPVKRIIFSAATRNAWVHSPSFPQTQFTNKVSPRTLSYYSSKRAATAKSGVPLYAVNNGSSSLGAARDLQEVLNVAEDAARQAGEIMKKTAGKIAVSKTKSNTKDLVTESDIACQALIQSIVSQKFPNDLFLGEEDVGSGSDASIQALQNALVVSSSSEKDGGEDTSSNRLLWIVDPIDGTTNFQAGLPLFCTSIGVVSLGNNREPEIVAGIIYNPALDEMTSAIRGHGAYLNGERISLSTTHTSSPDNDDDDDVQGIPLKEALVNVGFPVVKESTLAASSRAVSTLATKVRGLRMVAVAAQVMAWVAQNKFQMYISWDLNAWDVAAGMLIVEEAGGTVTDFDGQKATIQSRDLIVCSGPGGLDLSEELRLILQENDCLEYKS